MHRTQISLESAHYQRLSREASRLDISMSAVIRRLIEQHLGTSGGEPDPLRDITGIAEGQGRYVARRHNEYLYGKLRK
jgi:hypothetical protein